MRLFDSQYPIIKDGISVHFWKDLAILTDEIGVLSQYENVKYELNEQYTNVIALCDGTKSIADISDQMLHLYNEKKDNVIGMIEKMCDENILYVADLPKAKQVYWGERGRSYPLHLSLELTNRCNFACDFCYKTAKSIGSCMNSSTIYAIHSLIGGKTKNIQFTGGEPFLNDRIDEYIKLFANHNISIISNGSLLYDHDDSVLQKVSLYQLSLYGCGENDYYKNTRNPTGWNRLNLSIDKLNRLKCNYHLSVVLNKDNYLRIEEYVQAAIKLGARKIIFGTQTPVGRGLSSNSCLSIDEFRIAYRLMRIIKRKYYEAIDIEEWSHRGFSSGDNNEDLPAKPYQGLLSCGSGTIQFVVSQNGKVRPCELLPEEYFDLGGLEIIEDVIQGHFVGANIRNNALKYNIKLNKYSKDYAMFCGPLEHLIQKGEKE